MDTFLKKVDQIMMVDTSKIKTFFLKEKFLEFARIKSENPNFTQVEICKIMGVSDSTMRKVRNDLGIPSLFRRNTQFQNQKTKSKNTQFQTKKTKKTKSKNTQQTQQTESKNTQQTQQTEVDKKISIFKNINKDYLASGIEDEDTEEEEIKTENQMNKLFQDKK